MSICRLYPPHLKCKFNFIKFACQQFNLGDTNTATGQPLDTGDYTSAMFEDILKLELKTATTDQSLIANFWSEIKSYYDQPSRYYHNLNHLNHLIEKLLAIRNQVRNWQAVIFSVAYHDIIYDPFKKDNEEKSAEFAFARLTELGLPSILKTACTQQILATKHHNLAEDADTNYFTDADLSILGSDEAAYKTYADQIRKEYELVPDIVYMQGRQKVLRHFLEFQSIFKTAYFRERFEKQARTNIAMELESLSVLRDTL